MKKIVFLFSLALVTFRMSAQDIKPVLLKTFTNFDTSRTYEYKLEQSNKLSLIAKKWSNEWCAHYYYALSKAVLSFYEKDAAKRDALLDEADKEHEEAVSVLGKENDDTYVLAAMIANFRMSIDPSQRWQKYGQLFTENLQNAKEINADNPRMYYLQGTSKFFTPKAYGGGKKAAQPYFEKAATLFEKQKTDDITKPYWGKLQNNYFLSQCKVEDKD